VAGERTEPASATLAAATVGLFLVWSNSFVANGYLLGAEDGVRRVDWLSLTALRFTIAGVPAGAWCLLARRREALAALRTEGAALLLCGLLGAPLYNFALASAQQNNLPAPIASLTTALAPLFILVLSALFLGEHLTGRRVVGFLLAAAGLATIAGARRGDGTAPYGLWVAVAVLAPLCWSVYSVISKPRMRRLSPLLWTYMAIAVAGACCAPLLLLERVRGDALSLDGRGWAAVLYLALPCTVGGFALWTWLLRHLPASTVGFTVFLNPPLTTASKAVLAVLAPATFAFTITGREWLGGGLALGGLAVALGRVGARRSGPLVP
jgi:drug/metabolite transporter (DMT)-like permease